MGYDGNVSDILHTTPINLAAKVRFFVEKLLKYEHFFEEEINKTNQL
jgi:hypothetical protein